VHRQHSTARPFFRQLEIKTRSFGKDAISLGRVLPNSLLDERAGDAVRLLLGDLDRALSFDLPQKRKSKASVERILSWQLERIIISHGRCFESNAGAALRRLFGSLL
jgi:hypothetical protein